MTDLEFPVKLYFRLTGSESGENGFGKAIASDPEAMFGDDINTLQSPSQIEPDSFSFAVPDSEPNQRN